MFNQKKSSYFDETYFDKSQEYSNLIKIKKIKKALIKWESLVLGAKKQKMNQKSKSSKNLVEIIMQAKEMTNLANSG